MDLWYTQTYVKLVEEVHFLEDVLHACCADDQKLSVSVWWILFDQDEQSLQDDVGKLSAKVGELQESLNLIKYNK